MKVKELMELLQQQDPEKEVEYLDTRDILSDLASTCEIELVRYDETQWGEKVVIW